MSHVRHGAVAAVLALTLAACAAGAGNGPTPAKGATGGTKATASKAPTTTATIKGVVSGPVGYKAGKAAPSPFENAPEMKPRAPVEPTKDGAYREDPIADVEVYLTSPKGERFKTGKQAIMTNAKGEFTIENVPLNVPLTLMTNVDGEARTAELCAPAHGQAGVHTVNISYGGTLVWLNTLQSMSTNALGQLQQGLYLQLTAAVDTQLKGMKLSEIPDIADPKQIQAFMAKVTVDGQPASKLVGDLQAGLQTNGISANDVQNAFDQLNISFSGSITVSPAPAP